MRVANPQTARGRHPCRKVSCRSTPFCGQLLSTRMCVAALLAGAVFSQTPAQSAFEEAAIQTSPKSGVQVARGPYLSGGRYELRTATMVDFIAKAYGVDNDKVLGGPSWIEYDRFDLRAKMPPGTNFDSAKLMLQALLADRFKLVAHKETQQMPAFALTVGKGKPKLKDADGSGDSGCKFGLQGLPAPAAEGGPAPLPAAPMLGVTCRNMTMAAFAENLRTMPGASDFLKTSPVIDKTELAGAFDFDFKMSLAGLIILNGAPAASENISIADALDKQLGLKLDPIRVPLPVVVVEGVNRTPTPNSPDVDAKVPAAPVEFDVAEVRPSSPDLNGRMGIQIQPGGRVNITGLPLKMLIQQAWSINNDMIVGAPKWMDTDRYDVIARAPAGAVAAGPSNGIGPGPVDIDTVWAMMRALLAERFKLVSHMEDRPATAYTLVAVKPKIKKADPASRTKFTNGPADAKNSGGGPSRTVVFQNMTMAQFAANLQYIANGYIRNPVLDKTGLDGGYDFTLTFSLINPAQINLRGRGPDGDASEPISGLTVFEAVEKQLGLKLEETKRTAPFLVIDHVEQKPVEN